eukprot:6470005-Prymnesium_polylepis.1
MAARTAARGCRMQEARRDLDAAAAALLTCRARRRREMGSLRRHQVRRGRRRDAMHADDCAVPHVSARRRGSTPWLPCAGGAKCV